MTTVLATSQVAGSWFFHDYGDWEKTNTNDDFLKEFSYQMKMSSLGINSGTFVFEKKGIYNKRLEEYTLVYYFEEMPVKDSYFNVTMNDQWFSIDEGLFMDYVFISLDFAMKDSWENVTGKVMEKEGEFKLHEPPIMYAKKK